MEEWEEEWEIENLVARMNGNFQWESKTVPFFQEFFEFQLENRAQRVRKCLAEAYCSCRLRVARHGT